MKIHLKLAHEIKPGWRWGFVGWKKCKVLPVAHQRERATTCRPASSLFYVHGLVTLLARLSFCVLVCLAPMVQQPPHLSVCLCHLHVHCTREENIVFYFVLYIAILKNVLSALYHIRFENRLH